MKKSALILLSLATFSFSENIENIVDNAIKNNYDLISIQRAIDVASQNILLSKKWQNPVLTLGVNDIHFDEPLKRDAEPMQAQYLGFSQVIPRQKKLHLKESIAKKDKEIIALSLEDKKLKLKSKIYEVSYNILLLEDKMKLLNSYEKNINKLKKLSLSLYKYGKSNQNEILNADVSLVNLKIQKQNLQNMIDNLYLKLEQITYSKIDSIDTKLNLKELVLNMNLNTHPKILQEELKSKKFKDFARLEKENEKGDIKLNIAYFNRDDKYKDYANISVNIPLSFYNSEKIKASKARIQAKQVSNKLEDTKRAMSTELKVLENSANNAYKNYKLINEQIIPLKRKIQKNLENYNSFEKIKPQNLIKNLNELISYEIKAIDEKNIYFSNYAKSK